MAPISLADPSITSATPGVLVKGTVDPYFPDAVEVVNAQISSLRISDLIDPSYIVNDVDAYWNRLFFSQNGQMQLSLHDNVTGFGSASGPQFTETAEDNIYIVLFYGSTSAAWDFSVLDDSDETEPYTFSAGSVTAAGPTNNSALWTALDNDSTIAMLVDSSADGIDIANLTYEAPVANTAPTVTFTAPTTPVDGSATQTLTGTFGDPEGNDTATITIAASLGTAGSRYEGRCGGHVGSRVHRAGQHRLRTDRHRNRHGYRRWRD